MLIPAWRLGGTARYPLHRGTLARREVVFDLFTHLLLALMIHGWKFMQFIN
jgi:hypothetical protein